MKIFAISINGKKITIEVEPSETIMSLKDKLLNIVGIPPDQQRICFAGLFLGYKSIKIKKKNIFLKEKIQKRQLNI